MERKKKYIRDLKLKNCYEIDGIDIPPSCSMILFKYLEDFERFRTYYDELKPCFKFINKKNTEIYYALDFDNCCCYFWENKNAKTK